MKVKKISSQGFVLPVTLWVIAAAGLISAMLAEWLSDATKNAIAIKEKAHTSIALSNIQNEIIFVMSRRPYTYRGIQVGKFLSPIKGTGFNDIINADFMSDRMIRLDGRPYVVESNNKYIVKIQDGKGLINLNTINESYLKRMFSSFSIPSEQHDLLADTLIDYRDEDDFSRLSGAEANTYLRRGLYPPANQSLLTPWEAQRIIGWSNAEALWQKQHKKPLLTTCRASGFNPNTAPSEALITFIQDLTPDRTENLIEYRESFAFRSEQNIGDASGIILNSDPFFFSFLPGRCFIIDLIKKNTQEHIRFSLTLLPRNTNQPWQIDYVHRIPKKYQQTLAQDNSEVIFPSPEEIYRMGTNVDDINKL